ncbi:MAG TPA: hypothetical protein VFQ88_01120 [Nevskiaceae bacterium]|nr:hypothetical protein [Nevskiaceae bacterium]
MRGYTTHQAGSGSRYRQRGAVAVFVAVGIVALVASLLLVIDIGRLYYAQRQLQLDANMAALAGAQAGSGCLADSKGVPGNQDAITNAVLQSLQNNTPGLGTTGGSTNSIAYLGVPATPTFETGTNFSAISLTPGAGSVVSAVEVGQTVLSTNGVTNTFQSLPIGNSNVDSVRVTLAAQQPSSLLGSFFGTSTTKYLYASATAKQQVLGNYSLGTELANLDTGNSPLLGPLLSGLLGTAVDANVLYSKGVAAARVSLAGLEAAAGVNNLHDLMALNTNLTGALNILGQAVSGTAGGAISGLAGSAYNGDGGPTRNYFGDLFTGVAGNFNPGIDAVASQVPFVGALDLLSALGQDAAVGNGPIALQPGAGFLNTLDIPGVASLQTFVTLVSPPSIAPLLPADPAFLSASDPASLATAKTAQGVVSVRVAVNVAASVLGLINVNIIQLNLGLDADVAPAYASLTQLVCPTASSPPQATVATQTSIATIKAGAFDPTQPNPPLGLGDLVTVLGVKVPILGTIKLVTASVKNNQFGSTVGSAGAQPIPAGPFTSYKSAQGPANQTTLTAVPPDSQTVGSADVLNGTVNSLISSLTSKDNLQLKVAGVGLGDILDPLLSAVGTLVAPLTSGLDSVITQLTQALGLQLGTATVTMGQITLGQPVIVTNCLPGVAGANACPP